MGMFPFTPEAVIRVNAANMVEDEVALIQLSSQYMCMRTKPESNGIVEIITC